MVNKNETVINVGHGNVIYPIIINILIELT